MKISNIALLIGSFLITIAGFAQEPKVERQEDLKKVTLFYENGEISQQGTIKNGKLHGTWLAYDPQGNKSAIANYSEGKKIGKWLFWSDEKLQEVNYNDNKIVSVNVWKTEETIVSID
jgi:antitoxin component YwqK of YwqJK toxin-antitoxin module